MRRSRKGVIWWLNLPCAKSKAVTLYGTAGRELGVGHRFVYTAFPNNHTEPFVGAKKKKKTYSTQTD